MKNLIIIAKDGEVSPGQLITAELENTAFRTSSAHTHTQKCPPQFPLGGAALISINPHQAHAIHS